MKSFVGEIERSASVDATVGGHFEFAHVIDNSQNLCVLCG